MVIVVLANAPTLPPLSTNRFIPLTRFRQQHRRTEDGRLCAAAFVQDGQPYTNCTDATNPRNVAGREWCYVETQLLNKPVGGKAVANWDYCQPVADYDEMRGALDAASLEAGDVAEGAELDDAKMDEAAAKAAGQADMGEGGGGEE